MKYKVRVSHGIHKKGYLEYMSRILVKKELEKLKQSKTFTIVSCEELVD